MPAGTGVCVSWMVGAPKLILLLTLPFTFCNSPSAVHRLEDLLVEGSLVEGFLLEGLLLEGVLLEGLLLDSFLSDGFFFKGFL